MTLTCPKCKVDMKFTLWPSIKRDTWVRRADCAQCGGRIYGDVGHAAPKSAATIGVRMYCDCCHFECDKLFPVDTEDWNMVCGKCKDSIVDAQELEQIFNARLNRGE